MTINHETVGDVLADTRERITKHPGCTYTSGAVLFILDRIERAHAAESAALAALLPGVRYMGPPDGGSVTIMEQLRRMSEDAANWRATTPTQPPAEPAPQPAPSEAPKEPRECCRRSRELYGWACHDDDGPSDAPTRCTCPSGDGSLRWPCPSHPPSDAPASPNDAVDRLPYEVRRWCSGDAAWSNGQPCTSEYFNQHRGDDSLQFRAATDAPASPQAAQGDDPVGDFLRYFENRGESLFFSFGWEGVNLYNAAVKAHRLASAQPATAKPAGDAAIASLQAAIKSCDAPMLTEKGEQRASWDAVSFVQSHGKSVLTRLTGGSHD